MYVDIDAVDNRAHAIANPKPIPRRSTPSRARNELRAGDVIFSLVRPYLENVARVPADLDGQVASTAFCVLRPSPEITTDFLFYSLLRPRFIRSVKTYGDSPPSARDDEFLRLAINVPTVDEQEEAVAEIERQLTRLDFGRAVLDRSKARLGRYRASLLDAAWRGEVSGIASSASNAGSVQTLGAERDSRSSKRRTRRNRAFPVPTEPTGPLPRGWTWRTLDDLSWDASYGTSEKCSYESKGIPVLRIPNVVAGAIDTRDLKHAGPGLQVKGEEALQPNDLLMVRTNGSLSLVGRAASVAARFDRPHYFASYLIRFRLMGPLELGNLVTRLLEAPAVRRWMSLNAATSAGQHNISLAKLRRLSLPIPPIDLLPRVTETLEGQLSIAGALQTAVGRAQSRERLLRDAILDAAVAGAYSL